MWIEAWKGSEVRLADVVVFKLLVMMRPELTSPWRRRRCGEIFTRAGLVTPPICIELWCATCHLIIQACNLMTQKASPVQELTYLDIAMCYVCTRDSMLLLFELRCSLWQ
jgi:hypothetical protein